MIIGNLQRRWQESRPEVYDKETHIVCLDIVREDITIEGVVTEGYSFIPIEIDDQIDYGHIKSQLIEAGFAQKDEFGLVMNAVDSIITTISESTSWANFKSNLNTDDVVKFTEFCAFRDMCAEAAKEVLRAY